MSKLSRTKGANFEREIARYFNDHLYLEEKVRRNLTQYQEKGGDDMTLPGMSIECKRYKSVKDGDVKSWWKETLSQSEQAEGVPVLIYRADSQTAKVVMPAVILPEIAYSLGEEQGLDEDGYTRYRLAPECLEHTVTMELGSFLMWYGEQYPDAKIPGKSTRH